MNSKMSVKKIISLFLALVIVMATFSLMSCGKKSDEQLMTEINEAASEKNMTLSMYLMSEAPVDPITEAQVEEAINKITKKRLNTQLDLRYYTEEGYEYFSYTEGNVEKVLYMNAANEINEKGNGKMITSLDYDLSAIDLTGFSNYAKVAKPGYYDAIDKAIADRKIAEQNGSIKADKQNAEGSNETVLDEYGIPVPKYPAVTAYHMDILYIGGKDNFLKYKNNGNLSQIDEQLNLSSTLSTNISQLFLANMKSLNDGTFAIPTSKAVGEYTYLLLNKDALEAAYLKNKDDVPTDYSAFTSLTCESVKDFLGYIVSDTNTLSDTYYPISTNVSSAELLMSNLQYWGVDDSGKLSDAFSVLGGYYGKDDNYLDANTYAKFENLFANDAFVNDIKTLKEYELNGYYNATAEDFAVGYYKCNAAEAEALLAKYGKTYEIITVEVPRVDEDDLYSDMFAISSTTSNVGRSLKILEFMNSDEDFRNILLYGVEDEHYRFESTDVNNRYGEEIKSVTISPSSRYHMALEKTGNTFIAYPETGDSYTLKEFGIAQNQEAKTRLDLGFEVGSNSDAESLKAVKALSAAIWADYKAITNIDDFDTFIANARESIDNSEAVQANMNGSGLSKDYTDWLVSKKIIKAITEA